MREIPGNVTVRRVRADDWAMIRSLRLETLIAAAAEFARERGDQELTLDVHATNLPAIRAYERAGFEITSHVVAPSSRRSTR